mgnify:FL=1
MKKNTASKYKDSIKMTDNYKEYRKEQIPVNTGIGFATPLTAEEKAELKMRILLAISPNMA